MVVYLREMSRKVNGQTCCRSCDSSVFYFALKKGAFSSRASCAQTVDRESAIRMIVFSVRLPVCYPWVPVSGTRGAREVFFSRSPAPSSEGAGGEKALAPRVPVCITRTDSLGNDLTGQLIQHSFHHVIAHQRDCFVNGRARTV